MADDQRDEQMDRHGPRAPRDDGWLGATTPRLHNIQLGINALQIRFTKLSMTILRPALSKSIVNLLPSTAAIEPLPNLM